MEAINIREKLQTLNKELEAVHKKPKSNAKIGEFISEHKLEGYKSLLQMNVTRYLNALIGEIEAQQNNLNEKELYERQNYAEKQIKKLQNKLNDFDKQRITEIQNLISTIDNLKGYDKKSLPVVRVGEKQTVQIFKFLSNVNFYDNFVYLKNYLQRKIQFDFEKPTDKEIKSLEKLKRIVKQKENKFI